MIKYCDIKYAKELAEDFKDCECWWVADCMSADTRKYKLLQKKDFVLSTGNRHSWVYGEYPALTVNDVLEKLPASITKDYKRLIISPFSKLETPVIISEWCVEYGSQDNKRKVDKSLVNALCKMYIWLKKQGLLEGVNYETRKNNY